jgi:hypothetical protein
MQKLYFVAIFLFILSYFDANAQNNKIMDVDFIQSMTDGSKKAKQLLMSNPRYAHYLGVFDDRYKRKKPSKMPYISEPLIPKIMHQIWIGRSDLPPLYQNYLDECKKLHPDWEFRLWDDKSAQELNMEYLDLYDKMRNIPGRADILRYEILYKFGGLYRDMDVKCLRPVDELNHKYDFYSSLEFPAKSWKMPVINNGIIGSKPGHKILKATLESIRRNIDVMWGDFDKDVVPNFLKNPNFMTIKISMLPLTHAFIENISSDDKSIALPASYFMPIGYNNRNERSLFAKLLDLPPIKEYFQFIKPETLMWHNLDKQEVKVIDFDDGNGLKDPARKRLQSGLSNHAKEIYKIFKDIYSTNISASFNKKSKIPQMINFVVFNFQEMEYLSQHLPEWIMFNRDFKIKIWHNNLFCKSYVMKDIIFQDISESFSEIGQLLRADTSDNTRFYIALRILEKFGGNYAHAKAIARGSIFELGNKYNFYAALMPLQKGATDIKLSQKIVGASINHPVISKALAEIGGLNTSNLQKINQAFMHAAYSNIYFYNATSGKNIILPAIFFEPLSQLEDDNLYMISDYVTRFLKNITKSFGKSDRHNIVE